MSDDHHDESEHEGIQPDSSLSYRAKRAIAIHELLVEKGVIDAGEVEGPGTLRAVQVPVGRCEGRSQDLGGS